MHLAVGSVAEAMVKTQDLEAGKADKTESFKPRTEFEEDAQEATGRTSWEQSDEERSSRDAYLAHA